MKKRIILTVLVAIVMVCVLAVGVSAREIKASGKCGDNLTWTLYTDGELIIEGTGDMWDYASTPKEGEYSPFRQYSSFLKKLKIKEGITRIGDYAFTKCSNLKGELNIPESVESIGDYAFKSCHGFTGDLIIPDRVTTIGKEAFFDCNGFQGDIIIGDAVVTIGSSAFAQCPEFKGNIILGKSVETIGESAFYGNYGLTGSLVIPDSVKTIEEYAFRSCQDLMGTLTLGSGLTDIGQNAFYACNFTGTLTLPSKLTEIKNGVFYGCEFSGELKIPDNITKIGDNAFQGCKFTGELVIPDSVTSIGNRALGECKGFTGVPIIGKGLSTIGKGAFFYCNGFTGTLEIPSTVKTIEAEAFWFCMGINEVVIPQGVEVVGDYVFRNCYSLDKITVYSRDVNISWCAFYETTDNLTVYGYAGSTAETFANKYASKFITIDGVGVIASGTCGEGVQWTLFDNGELVISGNGYMYDYSTEEKGGKFITTAPWGDWTDKIKKLTIDKGVKSIGSKAFAYCSEISGDVVIPYSVEKIGDWAFAACSSLEKVTVYCADAVYGTEVFANTSSELTIYGYADSTTEQYANDNNLRFVEINERGVIDYGDCGEHLNWTLYDDGELVISGAGAINDYYQIYNFNTNEIYTAAPWGEYRNYIAALTLTDGVTKVGDNAFLGCSSLVKIYFRGNAPSVTPAGNTSASFDADVTFFYRPATTGWTDSEYYDAATGTWNGYTLNAWNVELKNSIRGVVTGYDPTVSTTITLVQNGKIVNTYCVEPTSGEGALTSEFVLQNIEEGVYDLVITKNCHLSYTIHGISVVEDIDLRTYSNELLSDITLQAGDINEDGCIDIKDVILLTSDNTYNLPYDDAVNKSADINGDNCFDIKDLVIITSDTNYGKSAIVVEY